MIMAGRKGGTDHGSHENEMEKFESFLEDKQLEELYAWVDGIPLSRPKRNIARDFSDGVLCAEIVKHYFDKLVELHNYTKANGSEGKVGNWNHLNKKVFRKLNFELADDLVNDLVSCKPGVIEKVLLMLKSKIDRAMYAKERMEKPESEQHEVSPGRKGGSIKVGTEGQKGGKFGKKHSEDYGYYIDSHYLKNRGWNSGVDPPMRHGKKSVFVDSDAVPRVMYEEREQEVLAKDEVIQILQAKISRLEHLLHLKDVRIEDLQNRVEASRPTGLRNDVTNRQAVQQRK